MSFVRDLKIVFFVQILHAQNCCLTWDCFFENAPGCTRTHVHAWDCPCEHSPRCTRTSGLAEVHQWNKVDSPSVCLLFDLLSFFVHCCLFASGIFVASGERSFCTCSRFASLTSLRDFQTFLYHNHGFPMAGLTERTSDFVLLSPWFHTWEQFVLSGLQGCLKDFCLSVTLSARRSNMHSLSPLKKWTNCLEIYTLERIRALIIKKWSFAFVILGWPIDTLWLNWVRVALLQHNLGFPRQA